MIVNVFSRISQDNNLENFNILALHLRLVKLTPQTREVNVKIFAWET